MTYHDGPYGARDSGDHSYVPHYKRSADTRGYADYAPPAPHPYPMVAPKSLAATYLLWFFIGPLGVHKFYLGNAAMGVLYASLTVVGTVLSLILIGFPLLLAVALMLFIDLFTIPGQVERANLRAAQPYFYRG